MTIRSALTPLALLCGGWLLVLSAVTVATDAAPAFVVLFPDQDLLDGLSEQTAIVSATAISVTLASEERGFARSLYSHGAWLVLPAGLRGCS